jgi:hypothetical protein
MLTRRVLVIVTVIELFLEFALLLGDLGGILRRGVLTVPSL